MLSGTLPFCRSRCATIANRAAPRPLPSAANITVNCDRTQNFQSPQPIIAWPISMDAVPMFKHQCYHNICEGHEAQSSDLVPVVQVHVAFWQWRLLLEILLWSVSCTQVSRPVDLSITKAVSPFVRMRKNYFTHWITKGCLQASMCTCVNWIAAHGDSMHKTFYKWRHSTASYAFTQSWRHPAYIYGHGYKQKETQLKSAKQSVENQDDGNGKSSILWGLKITAITWQPNVADSGGFKLKIYAQVTYCQTHTMDATGALLPFPNQATLPWEIIMQKITPQVQLCNGKVAVHMGCHAP